MQTLTKHGAMGHTIVVAASASEPAPMQYLAPYAACAMGEYFRDNGKHALVIYDDLSKHAMAYREISLLLRRPPGREAYPGDVFYLHSRLLERSSKLSDEEGRRFADRAADHRDPGGRRFGLHSDQRHFDHRRPDLSGNRSVQLRRASGGERGPLGFARGILGGHQGHQAGGLHAEARSGAVSRTGGVRAVRQRISIKLTQKQLNRGQRLTELLKQPQFHPLTWQQQVIILFAGTQGYLDDLKVIRYSRL